MNKVILLGRMVRDTQLSMTDSGTALVRFCVACDRRYIKQGEERRADFINCVAFGKTAEFINNYFSKGTRICLEGCIRTGSYTDKEGNKRYTTDVLVEAVEFAQNRNEGTGAHTGQVTPAAAAPNASAGWNEGFTPAEDEYLPF